MYSKILKHIIKLKTKYFSGSHDLRNLIKLKLAQIYLIKIDTSKVINIKNNADIQFLSILVY